VPSQEPATIAPAPAAERPKYVVPARRAVDNSLQVLVRRICNKLTVTNVSELAKELVELFASGKHPRAQVVAAFSTCITANCLEHTGFTTTIAFSYAGMIRAVQLEFGNEAVAPVVEHISQSVKAALAADNDDVAKNGGVIMAHLLLLHGIVPTFITTFVRALVTSPSIASLHTALHTLRASGDRLRADCPTELNQLVATAQKTRDGLAGRADVPLVRFSVIVDFLREIASGANRRKKGEANKYVDENAAESVNEALCDHVKTLTGGDSKNNRRTQRKAVASMNMLAVSFEQCCAADKAPQWYLSAADAYHEPEDVKRKRSRNDGGGADDDDVDFGDGDYAEEGEEEEDEEDFEDEEYDDDEEVEAAPRVAPLSAARKERALEKAAVSQRFSTELRRKVFDCIAECTDDTDCFHRLNQMGATSSGTLSDVATVVLQCNQQQQIFNAFYGRLLHRLLSGVKRFKNVLQFAIWDRVKMIRLEDVDLCSFVNFAALLTYLFREGLYGMSLLRGLDMDTGMSKAVTLFSRVLFLRLLVELPARILGDLFFGGSAEAMASNSFRVDGSDATSKAHMRQAMTKFFARYFVDEDESKKWIPHLFEVVASGVEGAEHAIGELPGKMKVVHRALRDGI
jgi:hypothetical protein